MEWNKTRFSERLRITYPIVQGPLGGLSSQRLTATVSNFGGLGSFGALGLAPAAIKDVIAELRSLTPKPFAMNLWVSTEDEGAFAADAEAFDCSLAPLLSHLEGLGVTRPFFKPYLPVRFEDQARVLLDEKVPVFSFIYGIPPKEVLDECHRQDIRIIGTATTSNEALALQEAGVDAIVASGFEAGGHRGSFLRPAEESLMGTFSLVRQVSAIVDVPVVAAGGIADAHGIAAALTLGAEGVQLGTAFAACEESGASQLHREALLSGRANQTGLTKGFTGRLARGVRNQLMDELNQPGIEILPYPLQRLLIKNLTMPAEKARCPELVPLWAGQGASLLRYANATELLQNLVAGVTSIYSGQEVKA